MRRTRRSITRRSKQKQSIHQIYQSPRIFLTTTTLTFDDDFNCQYNNDISEYRFYRIRAHTHIHIYGKCIYTKYILCVHCYRKIGNVGIFASGGPAGTHMPFSSGRFLVWSISRQTCSPCSER